MKRHSNNSIIPKIILILGTLSVLGIILLFLRPRPLPPVRLKKPETPEKLFTQVMKRSQPEILKLWEEGDRFFPSEGTHCEEEIQHEPSVGKSYYQCNPHFWQCFWQGGVKEYPTLEIDFMGQRYHLQAVASFPGSRYYSLFKRQDQRVPLAYGYQVEFRIQEIPGYTQSLLLADTCRDILLPQRIYGYSKPKDKTEEGFIWDNFGREIFLDRFYVTNRQVNEWRSLTGKKNLRVTDPKEWPKPALLNLGEQKDYCSFYGKSLLEAKLFDAASMTPGELKNPLPEKVYRPDTPWQRDLSRSFLGMARINPDYQLTPLDCQLAQVQGCHEKYFTTDSATWMGFHYSLGFYPESLNNHIEPEKNIKLSSRFYAPGASWHELGVLGEWSGIQDKKLPVAFRCFEEVSR